MHVPNLHTAIYSYLEEHKFARRFERAQTSSINFFLKFCTAIKHPTNFDLKHPNFVREPFYIP